MQSSSVKFPCWSHQSQYPNTSGLGSGNICITIYYTWCLEAGHKIQIGPHDETNTTIHRAPTCEMHGVPVRFP